MPFVPAGGHLVHVVDIGEGPRTFVAHGGWVGTWELWQEPFQLRAAPPRRGRERGAVDPTVWPVRRPRSSPEVGSGTVTKPVGQKRCRWCGRGFETVAGPGRPREYCKRSCRQREYEAKRRSSELGLSESELVMAKSELDELRDALYVLEAAVEDVDRDLAESGEDPAEVKRALDWILQAARPLLELRP